MTRFTRNTMVFGFIAALCLCLTVPASAQDTVQVTASWTAPTTGSPVQHYVLQLSINGGPFTTVATVAGLSTQLELEIGQTYTARVAGVDSQDRQGSWSETSDPYTPDLGVPGQPGKPLIL
jgi:hypothetical protein